MVRFSALATWVLLSAVSADASLRGHNKETTTGEAIPRDLEMALGGSCATNEFFDVVVIGAGMAGLAATARLQEFGLNVVLLESTSDVGGRMRKTEIGAPDNRWTVEIGANWIADIKDNPILEMAEDENLDMEFQDWYDWTIYDDNGDPLNMNQFWSDMGDLDSAWNVAASRASDLLENPQLNSPLDGGVRSILANNGWTVPAGPGGNMKYYLYWWYMHYSYLYGDTGTYGFGLSSDAYFVTDQRGFSHLADQFLANRIAPGTLRTNTRVSEVHYDLISFSNSVKAKVMTNGPNGCKDFYTSRVVSTVSSGVVNSGLINFSPPLKYSANSYNPYVFGKFVKVFVQFTGKFWDDTQFVGFVRDERGECQHWQSLDTKGFMEGSRTMFCLLMTEAYDNLKDPVTNELSPDTIDSFIDPLRQAYGADKVDVADTFYHNFDDNADWGYGAYSNWRVGKNHYDFGKFFGGVEGLTEYCDFNGCNRNDEWILYMSGACSCYERWENVDGAHNAGIRSAHHLLASMGYDVDTESECDQSFSEYAKLNR